VTPVFAVNGFGMREVMNVELKDFCPQCQKKIKEEQLAQFIFRVNELEPALSHEAAVKQAREELKEKGE